MKADHNGRLRVLTWDGSLTQVAVNGQIVARQAIAPADMQKVTGQLRSVPDPAVLEIARKHALVGRIVKTSATHDDLVAVAYWGGTLQLLHKGGQAHSLQLLPQDITGPTWLGGKLVVGLGDGRLVGLTIR